MTACALTDHGSMGGLLEFQKELLKAEVQPLLGCESYVTSDPDGTEKKTRDNHHVVLIAKNNQGLRDLMRLQSEGATKNFYYKPRIHVDKLDQLSGNVVVTSACLKGILTREMIFQQDDYGVNKGISITEKFHKLLDWLLQQFGEDFYIEIQAWDDETHIQRNYNEFMIDFAQTKGVPLVITSDCHYLKEEDYETHEMMMALQLGTTLEEYRSGDVMKYGNHFYVRSPEEMSEAATELGVPEAVSNTVEAAKKCEVEIETGTYYLPIYKPKESSDYEEFLRWRKKHQI